DFEELIAERYAIGKPPNFNMAAGPIRGEMHLAVGQDGVAVGNCSLLTGADAVVSAHRPHRHALAEGIDPASVADESVGKESRLSRGQGVPLHRFDVVKISSGGVAVLSSHPRPAGAGLSFGVRGQPAIGLALCVVGKANPGSSSETVTVAV